MNRPGVSDPLARFAPPRVSDALRERVLVAARSAIVASPSATRADRIWFSPAWRVAWVAALAALAALEVVSVRGIDAMRGGHGSSQATTGEADAAATELGLSARGWVGERVVTSDAIARGAMEELQ